MNYFIFDFDKDLHYIDSFLESAELAHQLNKRKSREWFLWKFRDNPFGKAILACAEDNGEIVGCVGYGMQPFVINQQTIDGILSFETFVHPSYQGKGVFGKLLKMAEEEAVRRKIAVMVNFPNSNSIKGFIKSEWKQLDKPEYWIKARSLLQLLLSLQNLRRSFKPKKSNLPSLKIPLEFNQEYSNKKLMSQITLEYLKWRFFSFPVGEYEIVDTTEFYSILRIGNRGSIREAQVLFINMKATKNLNLKRYLKFCKSQVKYDLISFPISKNNPVRPFLKRTLFFNVPNKTNICFKILNENILKEEDVRNISLSAINYHTY